MRSVSNSPNEAADAKLEDWQVFFPALYLHDWKIQTMSALTPKAAASSKRGLLRQGWLFAPQKAETR